MRRLSPGSRVISISRLRSSPVTMRLMVGGLTCSAGGQFAKRFRAGKDED